MSPVEVIFRFMAGMADTLTRAAEYRARLIACLEECNRQAGERLDVWLEWICKAIDGWVERWWWAVLAFNAVFWGVHVILALTR